MADVSSPRARCLGADLASVIEVVRDMHPDLVWYAGDMQVNGPSFVVRREPTPVRIGDTAATLRLVGAVDQFESGVLAGVPANVSSPCFRDGGLWTEDDDDADLGDSIVEIRAFDTTYVIVTTTDDALGERIAAASVLY